ncbi:uncharacterized protein LOC129266307 [Lytechinus pictus]|uniref:uncharacterized protein LOC129266307 n=1 Tax=Lytechinus pictus TaxID=7653 RepID=UPI0030B9F060
MDTKRAPPTRHNRIRTYSEHSDSDWPLARYQVTSEVTRDFMPFALVIIIATALFIATTIVYLHTTSGPVLRASAEKAQELTRRSQLLQGNDEGYSRSIIYSSPRGDMCFLRSKLTKTGMPTIHSIFADPVSHNVVIVGVRIQHWDWQNDSFVCEYDKGQRVSCDAVVSDDRSFGYRPQYVIIITCPIPASLQERTNFSVSLYRAVDGAFSRTSSYENITVCSSGASKRQRRMLSVCTMLKDSDEFVPDWVAFHRHVGANHIFIYDNQEQELSKLRETVAKEIENGFVTVIPWSHQSTPCKNYLEVQIAHENDCLWRNRHISKWMIKIDVDEYVQPMNPNKPRIPDYLSDPLYDRVGAARLQNWFFGRPNTSIPLGGQSLIQRNQWRSAEPTEPNASHDKNILRPINVHYFKIHAMKLGGSAVTLDPWRELRLVHYRGDNPRKLNFKLPDFSVQDSSMSDTMDLIAKQKL